MRKSNKGFTLVELLVVIAIIGILSSVVLVSLNSARSKARDARRISDIHQIALALENYYDATARYPGLLSNLTPTYLAQVPLDPQSGTTVINYKYSALLVGTSCGSYHLGIALENAGNSAFNSDADAAASTSICSDSVADFDGTGDPTNKVYDIKP